MLNSEKSVFMTTEVIFKNNYNISTIKYLH